LVESFALRLVVKDANMEAEREIYTPKDR